MELWTDEEFQAVNSSVYFNAAEHQITVEWTRPSKIHKCPKLRQDSTALPIQGSLGNCWLICAFYTLARNTEAWEQVFRCKNKYLYGDDYNGRVAVWLFICGSWQEICVDDQLPTTIADQRRTLLYGICDDDSQFWVPILEKAFAKVYGCYHALCSGQVSEGYLQVTGGFTWKEHTKYSNVTPKLLNVLIAKIMTACSQSKTSQSCQVYFSCDTALLIDRAGGAGRDVLNSSSSIQGGSLTNELHCYCLVSVDDSDPNNIVIFAWNPWRKPLSSLTKILLSDLLRYDPVITFATTRLHELFFESPSKEWPRSTVASKWTACKSSGGNRRCASYCQNPQFLLSVKNMGKSVTVIHLTLSQTPSRRWSSRKQLEQAIGIHVWKLPSRPNEALNLGQISSLECAALTSPAYEYSQNVSLMFSSSGRESEVHDIRYFLAIPSTYAPNVNANFFVRVCCPSLVSFCMVT